jgi:hypothetical protein
MHLSFFLFSLLTTLFSMLTTPGSKFVAEAPLNNPSTIKLISRMEVQIYDWGVVNNLKTGFENYWKYFGEDEGGCGIDTSGE